MRNIDEKTNPSYNCIKKEKIPKTNVNKEKEMATHSCILAWRITWTEETGGLQFMGSQRVGNNLATEQQ